MYYRIVDKPIPPPPNVRAEFERILRDAIEVIGLTDAKGTLELAFYPIPDDTIIGFGEHPGEPDTYVINVNPLAGTPFPDVVRGICHEIVHAKQMVDGDLKFTEDNHAIWHGEDMGINDHNDDDTHPWEKDADERGILVFMEVSKRKAEREGVSLDDLGLRAN